MTLAETKNFLRIALDFIDDDSLIESLVSSAKTMIKEKTGKAFENEPELFKLVVNQLVKHWYDNRDSISDKPVCDVPYTINSLIQHLGLCGEYV